MSKTVDYDSLEKHSLAYPYVFASAPASPFLDSSHRLFSFPQSETGAVSAHLKQKKLEVIKSQPAFVLHSYPHKETSLIVEIFTRDFGKISLVAKGAKRPTSSLRHVLLSFQAFLADWSGKHDMKILTQAEWVGGMLPLEGTALLCGFYLNELLVKLVLKQEPLPELFDVYVKTLCALAQGSFPSVILRQFEVALLQSMGVFPNLTHCSAGGQEVQVDVAYVLHPIEGLRMAMPYEMNASISGKTLLDMHHNNYEDAHTQQQSKMLMRTLINHHLQGQALNTRQILIDLHKL